MQFPLMLLELFGLGLVHFLALISGLRPENLVADDNAVSRSFSGLGIRFLGLRSGFWLRGLQYHSTCQRSYILIGDELLTSSSSSSSKMTSCTFLVPSVIKIPVSWPTFTVSAIWIA